MNYDVTKCMRQTDACPPGFICVFVDENIYFIECALPATEARRMAECSSTTL